MHISRKSRWLPALAIVTLATACGGEAPPKDPLTTDAAQDGVQEVRQQKSRKIFYTIPSPMETAALLKRAGAAYDARIPNDVRNVDRYTTASKQALNLGVYGADLSYASVHNQTQESMFYTSCSKRLAENLGVTGVFNESVLERMERNMNNRDSLLDIISTTYWDVDAYMKENGRENISALMITGGWVEGLYIATQVAAEKGSLELRQRVAEQKHSLNDLIGLLNTYPDDPTLAGPRADLQALAELFLPVMTGSAGESVTVENGVTVVGAGQTTPAAITDEQFTAIRDKVAEIRNNYIK